MSDVSIHALWSSTQGIVIQCFNPSCRAVSTPPASHCKACQTPLLYRFVLAVGDRPVDVASGSLVAGRFLVWGQGQRSARGHYSLWLDTRPDIPTPALEQMPPLVLSYLKLFHLAQHVPRPYAYLTPEQTGLPTPMLLLDAAPLATRLTSGQSNGPGRIELALLPSLAQAWAGASALRQLNWLRQAATLWPPLAEVQGASTLLDLADLRVDGALLRLTTLAVDEPPPALAELGRAWQGLLATAQPPVRPYLGWLVRALMEDRLGVAELVADLEGAIDTLAQGLGVTVDWAAGTDQGPTRDRNEDACYPSGAPRQVQLNRDGSTTAPLLLVCDGIGGHEQGSVASETAIKLLQQELEPLAGQMPRSPRAIAQRLKQAVVLANDAIAARNNDEQRSARARMGTTVVAALVHFPYVFIVNVGDSRAYRVSPHTCYQITVDDDVASREAQMGYALYSEAVQLPSSGALIQALGISDSGYLYPSVQHLLLDDSAVLLLCSDGLSDYDRVETLAPALVAPLATAKEPSTAPLAPTLAALIEQANRLNGHDNVTVGLMRFRPQVAALPTLPARSCRGATDPDASAAVDSPIAAPATIQVSDPVLSERRSRVPWLPLLGGAALVAGGLAGGVAIALGSAASRRQPPVALRPLSAGWTAPALAGQPLPENALAATVEVPVGSFWQVHNALGAGAPLQLLPQPATSPGVAPLLVTGSILRVTSRQTAADGAGWVRAQVCSIPSGASLEQRPQEGDGAAAPAPDLAQRLAAPANLGWIPTRQFYSAATSLELVTPDQATGCSL